MLAVCFPRQRNPKARGKRRPRRMQTRLSDRYRRTCCGWTKLEHKLSKNTLASRSLSYPRLQGKSGKNWKIKRWVDKSSFIYFCTRHLTAAGFFALQCAQVPSYRYCFVWTLSKVYLFGKICVKWNEIDVCVINVWGCIEILLEGFRKRFLRSNLVPRGCDPFGQH